MITPQDLVKIDISNQFRCQPSNGVECTTLNLSIYDGFRGYMISRERVKWGYEAFWVASMCSFWYCIRIKCDLTNQNTHTRPYCVSLYIL